MGGDFFRGGGGGARGEDVVGEILAGCGWVVEAAKRGGGKSIGGKKGGEKGGKEEKVEGDVRLGVFGCVFGVAVEGALAVGGGEQFEEGEEALKKWRSQYCFLGSQNPILIVASLILGAIHHFKSFAREHS